MVWKPHVTVAALAEDNQGRFLLVEERVNAAPVLNQPAGHLEAGESLLDAVRREAREETAWAFTPEALVGIYRWARPGDGATYLRVTFAGRVSDHRPDQALDTDILRTLWLSPDELRARQAQLRSPMVWRSVADYRAGRRYPLDILSDL